MRRLSRRFVIPIFFLMIPVLAFAITGVPDPNNCLIETRALENVSVMVCPGCDGYPYSAAHGYGGYLVDATIEVIIQDGEGLPIANFPFEDIWLDGVNLCFCPGGSSADQNTDAYGYTEFAFPSCGGGSSQDFPLVGYINGYPISPHTLPFIKINSPDLNCDWAVDLVDLSTFAAWYLGDYYYFADFYWDGVQDLRDLAIFSQHYSHECY